VLYFQQIVLGTSLFRGRDSRTKSLIFLLVAATAMATSRGSFAGMRIAVDIIMN